MEAAYLLNKFIIFLWSWIRSKWALRQKKNLHVGRRRKTKYLGYLALDNDKKTKTRYLHPLILVT